MLENIIPYFVLTGPENGERKSGRTKSQRRQCRQLITEKKSHLAKWVGPAQ